MIAASFSTTYYKYIAVDTSTHSVPQRWLILFWEPSCDTKENYATKNANLLFDIDSSNMKLEESTFLHVKTNVEKHNKTSNHHRLQNKSL